MTDSGLNILHRKLSAFIEDGRQVFFDEIRRESAKDASRGFPMPSGALIYKKVELSAERIRTISKKGLEVINDLAVRQVVKIDALSKQAIIETVMSEVLKEADMLNSYVDEWLRSAPQGNSLPNIITESVVKAKEEIEIELDILINAKKTSEVNSVINVYNYGTANTIQAGHNNNITHSVPEKSEKLVAALNALLQQIKEQEVSSLPSGLTTSLEETLVELQRPDEDRNPFKIQASLMMAMTTLQTLPVLKPAVTTLATAYDYYFGTSLSTVFS